MGSPNGTETLYERIPQSFPATEIEMPGMLRDAGFCRCYWSEMVYVEEGSEACGGGVEEQATGGRTELQYAMDMYGLTSTEEVWDRGMDTRAVLAWGQGTLLIAFKGTSSAENIKTDLKVTHEGGRAQAGLERCRGQSQGTLS